MSQFLDLAGIIPPIPTPFQEGEELYPKALEANLKRWNQATFRGYLVLGSNGESIHLSPTEQSQVMEVARVNIPGDRVMIVGASAQAARGCLDFIAQAARIGADAVLVSTPCYFKPQMTQGAIVEYYSRIADGSRLPILLYNVPQFTGVGISSETITGLANHPNIIGVKESSGSIALCCEILRDAPPSFQVLCGSTPSFYATLEIGAVGGVLAVACVAWELCLEILSAYQRGDRETARRLQIQIVGLSSAVTSQFGVGGLKAALALRGFYGGPPRCPLSAPGELALSQLRKMCEEMNLSQLAVQD